MRFGKYYSTSAKNLREFNKTKSLSNGKCGNCGKENAVRAIYMGYVCNDSFAGEMHKTRGYQWQCKFCKCTLGQPFKIYFNDEFAE